MKKIIGIVLLLLSAVSFAQQTQVKTEDDQDGFYIGGGVAINNKFKIDDKLEASNLPQIVSTVPDFVFGFSHLERQFLMDFEVASNVFKKSNSTTSSNGSRSSFRLRGQYNFVNNNHVVFSGGLNLAFTSNDFNVYSQSNQVDLNNLASSTASYIRLRNNMFFVGPSVGFGIKSKNVQVVRFNIGYEIAALTGKWKSDYATVSNSIRENGQNRLMIGAVVFFYKHRGISK